MIQPPNCSSTLQTRGSIDSHVTCKEHYLTVALPTLHDLTIRHHGICRNCVGAAAPGDLSSDRHDCSTHPELRECVVVFTCGSQTLAQGHGVFPGWPLAWCISLTNWQQTLPRFLFSTYSCGQLCLSYTCVIVACLKASSSGSILWLCQGRGKTNLGM